MLFWQSTSQDAPDSGTYAEHYRYNLPKAITDSAAWAAGVSLPAGMMYLWDPNNTGTIIEGVTFTALPTSPTTWGFFVPNGTQLDDWLASDYGLLYYPTARLQSTSHDQDHYPNNGLKLITVGCSLSELVASVVEQFLSHDHESANSPVSRPVSHEKLGGLFNPTGFTPQLDASQLDNDDHPQYLHRQGYGTSRDKFGNSMLGDILMASTDSGNDYRNDDADSRKIHFGQTDGNNSGRIYYDSATGKLVLHGRRSSASTGGVILGDPSVSSSAAWIFTIWNYDMAIQPYGNSSSADLYLDADTVRVGTNQYVTDSIIIGGNGSSYHDLNTYIRAGNHIDIACGEGNIPSVSLYDDAITIRAGAGIDIRTQGGNGGTAGDDDIVISAGSDVWIYADSSIRFNQPPRLMSDHTTYVALGCQNWSANDTRNERAIAWWGQEQFWRMGPGGDILYTWCFLDRIPGRGKIDWVQFWTWVDDVDYLRFWIYSSHYGNNHTQIGYKFKSGNDAWATVQVNCGGSELYNNRCLGVKLKHSDDNASEGGPDGYVYVHGVAEAKIRVWRISAFTW
jgi:hypothetical protein